MDGESALYTPQYGQEPRKEEENAARFEVEVSYTFQDLLALNRLVGKTTRKWRVRILRVILGVLGFILLGCCALMLASERLTMFSAVNFIFGVLTLALAFFYHYLNAGQSKRMMMKFSGVAHFTFGEEELSERTSLGSSQHPYKVIYVVNHYKDRFFIFLDEKHSYILPESGFVKGLPTEFESFLKEKSGKPVEYIR